MGRLGDMNRLGVDKFEIWIRQIGVIDRVVGLKVYFEEWYLT